MKINNFNLEKNATYIITELSANHNVNIKNTLDTIKAAKKYAKSPTRIWNTTKYLINIKKIVKTLKL